jgi:non-canonical purine NTP pyrophosphatase (RdgB/HAM1 family)
MAKHIIFITENVSKFKEIENYISKSGINVSIQMIKPEYEIQEIQSLDRQEIVLKKLRDAFAMSKQFINLQNIQANNKEILIMVEDTSLCIDKMGGFPGPFIKYYVQSLPLNVIADANWGSSAQSYVSLAISKLDEHNELNAWVFEDCVVGNIVSPVGTNGFGYDMIFRPVGTNHTCAEMTMDEKKLFNPRTKAFQKVIKFLGLL